MTTTMTPEQLAELTGYKRPADQIRALHAAGYWLATLTPAGVSLPMEHYRAVCAGAMRKVAPAQEAKKWKLVLLITAAFTVDVVGGTDTR